MGNSIDNLASSLYRCLPFPSTPKGNEIRSVSNPKHKADDKTTKSIQTAETNESIQMAELGVKAYPNPFTDHLYFDLQLKTDSKVRLEIFDINGSKLATVYNDVVVAFDHYQLEYTPKNVSSGILFYRLTVDGQLMFNGELIHY